MILEYNLVQLIPFVVQRIGQSPGLRGSTVCLPLQNLSSVDSSSKCIPVVDGTMQDEKYLEGSVQGPQHHRTRASFLLGRHGSKKMAGRRVR
nr:hypothetical protein CFP56_30778 [Quercus suber]